MARTIDGIGLGLASLRALWKRLGGPPTPIAAALRASRPPLTEPALRAVEERLGATLPEDYRDFVTRISNGGIGPGVGLFSVDDAEQWRALPGRRWSAPERSATRFELTQDVWGAPIWMPLTGAQRGTLWIDQEEGPRPLSVSGQAAPRRAEPTTFGPWFLWWIEAQREADALIAERRDAVSTMLELSQRVLAPARTTDESLAHEFKKLSADEAWETLVARGLVEESDERRSFASPCPERTKGRSPVHPSRCTRCAGSLRVTGPAPATVAQCLAVASCWSAMLAAEPLARELATRLNEWGPVRARSVQWSPFDPERLVARSRPGDDRVDVQSLFALAFTRIVGVGARAQAYVRECDEVIARVLGSEAPPAKLLAANLANRHLTIERLRAERTSVAYEELARYSPFEPALALWKCGVALSSITEASIELMFPPVDGATPPDARRRA